MTNLIYVQPNGVRLEVEAPDGMTVMQAAVDTAVEGIIAACAGSCACGTCHVYIDERYTSLLPPISTEEDNKLDEVAAPVKCNSRMACRVVVTPRLDGMVVHIPTTQG
ncbi:MAG: 2Fe-2S iron-sulfur cluster-binding protein [Hyphomicrobiales bacterium]